MLASAQVIMSTPNFYRQEIAHSEFPNDNAALTPPLDVMTASTTSPTHPA